MSIDDSPLPGHTEEPTAPRLECPPHMLPTLQLLAMQTLYQMAFEQVERDARASAPRPRPEPHWN